jgi:nitroimidazol reductase NimA-like FMN-containing flavoprotein (pyridoxamine 5'-phosphate oxidase superfamily)
MKNKMADIAGLKQRIETLFTTQKLAVLSSYGKKQPYASLVAFAATEDLKYILFATTRSTRKYTNLTSEPNAALLIDDRSNEKKDFSQAIAATVLGRSEEVSKTERDSLQKIYLAKHPHLKEFVSSPTCALIKVRVRKYYVVSKFQNVKELHMS